MSTLTTTVTIASSLVVSNESGVVLPSQIEEVFSAKERMVERVYSIPAAGSIVITKTTEGFDVISYMRLECLTLNKSLDLKFNAATTGFPIKPLSTTSKSFLEGPTDFDTLEITNLDADNPVYIALSVFEKA